MPQTAAATWRVLWASVLRKYISRLITTVVTENRGGTGRDRFKLFGGEKMTTGRDGRIKT